MFILLAIILGLLIGLVRGGKIKGITSKKISLWPLGLVGLLLQVFLHLYYYTGGIASIESFLPIVNFVSYILILVTFVFNLDDFWTILVAMGITANFVVTFINGGHMPVVQSVVDGLSNTTFAQSISQGTNAIYAVLQTGTTALWFMGINIPVPFVGSLTAMYGSVPGFSVGGILVFLGVIGMVQYAMNRVKTTMPFGKDASFGTEEYILPPTEDGSDLFKVDGEEDTMERERRRNARYTMDDFFAEDSPELFAEDDSSLYADPEPDTSGLFEEETPYTMPVDSTEELTEMIPKLTPEMVDEIRRNSLESIGDPKSATASSDTRVFTALNNLGNLDAVEERKSVVIDEPQKTDEGFFTQSFRADRFKTMDDVEEEEDDLFEETAMDEPKITREPVGKPVFFDALDEALEPEPEPEPVFEEEPMEKPASPWISPAVKDEPIRRSYTQNKRQRSYGQSRKVNPYAITREREDEEMSKNTTKRTEEDMMNIWQQVSAENKMKRNRAKTTPVSTVSADAYLQKEKTVEVTPEAAPMSAAQATQAREKMAQKWDAGVPKARRENQESAQGDTRIIDTQSVRKAVQGTQAPKSKSDEERERAGYEKVEIEIDGRTVAFWRKKKA